DRRYQAVLISEEEAAQVARLRYLLAHGTKEGIVASPLDWPGPHSAGQLLSQESMPVEWGAGTDQRRLRNDPEALRAATHRYDFRLAPLPCWAHKSREWIREAVAEMLQEIEQEAAQQRRDSHRSTVPSRKGSAAARRRGPGRLTDL